MSATAKRNPHTRNRISDVLLWIAAVGLVVSACSLYVSANVFDSTRFADHAVAALEEPEVRAVLVDNIGDLIVTEIAEDAVAVRPLIDTVSGAAIESAAFQRLFRTAALQLHESAVDGDQDNAVLTVANIGIVISQALRQLLPDLGDQIPETLDDALLEVASFDSITALSRAAKISDDLALWSTVITLLLLIAAFVVSPNRLRAVGGFGLTLIASGGVIATGYFVVRYLVLRPIVADASIDRAVGEQIWDAFMSDLFTIGVLMIGLGAVLAAMSDGALSGVRVQDRVRDLARFAVPPESTRGRIVWSLVAVVLGLWLATNPQSGLEVLVALTGLVIVATGLQELALLATSETALTAVESSEDRRRRRKRYVRFAVASIAAAAIGIATIGAVHLGGGIQSLGIAVDAEACNGSRDLCDRPLNEVAIAATHNSMSVASSPKWLFPAQEASIGDQLDDGIHGLLIDAYFAYPGQRVYTDTVRSSPNARSVMREQFGDEFVDAADRIRRSISKPKGVEPELFLCHGFCELGATSMREALDEVRGFIEDNPRDVVVIVVEDYVPWEDLAEEFRRAGLQQYAYRGPWGPVWPTLGEMINDGQRLLITTENAEPRVDWMHNAFQSMQETPFHFETVSQLREPSSCDESRGEPDTTIFQINHWVDTAPNPRPSIARRVNDYAFLGDRIKRCERDRKLLANLIAVDFYREGDLFTVVDELNTTR